MARHYLGAVWQSDGHGVKRTFSLYCWKMIYFKSLLFNIENDTISDMWTRVQTDSVVIHFSTVYYTCCMKARQICQNRTEI